MGGDVGFGGYLVDYLLGVPDGAGSRQRRSGGLCCSPASVGATRILACLRTRRG